MLQPYTRVRLLRIFDVAGMFPALSSYRIIVKALCEGGCRVGARPVGAMFVLGRRVYLG